MEGEKSVQSYRVFHLRDLSSLRKYATYIDYMLMYLPTFTFKGAEMRLEKKQPQIFFVDNSSHPIGNQ